MKKATPIIGISAALALSTFSITTARAMPIAPLHLDGGDSALLQETQFIFRGRRYCWYWDGWRGPGWYWCGYAFRRGLGWAVPEVGMVGVSVHGPGRVRRILVSARDVRMSVTARVVRRTWVSARVVRRM
jgi:hypothetical protein